MARLLVAALIALYALTYHGSIGSVIDESMMLGVTVQLAEAHTFQINALYPALLAWQAPGTPLPTGIAYAKYAPGQSILALPLYALGTLFPNGGLSKTPGGQPFLPLIPVDLAMLTGMLVTLATAYGIYRTALLLDTSRRTAARLVVLYAVTTLAWPYAKTFYNEPSTACALIGMVFFSITYRRSAHHRDGIAAGACLGAAILLRTSSVVFIPFLLLYLLPHISRWLLPLIGIGVGIGLTLAYNQYRFGSPFESGYEPGFGRAPWEALLGYVISPSRSVFLFNPVLILVPPGIALLFRHWPRETGYLAALIAAPVAVYAGWWAWDGGASLGPRFLIPAIPLAVLLLAPLLNRARWRVPVAVLGALGLGVQLLCNLATPADIFEDLFAVRQLTPQAVNWQISDSIAASLWPTYLSHRIDSLLLHALPLKAPLPLAALFVIAACLLTGVMLWACSGFAEATESA